MLLFLLVAGLFGNGYSQGCLFQMVNGLSVNGTELQQVVHGTCLFQVIPIWYIHFMTFGLFMWFIR